MKKNFSVIVVLVVCLSSIFAKLTGYATAEQMIDFVNKKVDYNVSAYTEGSILFSLFGEKTELGEKKGSIYPYNEFAISAKVDAVSAEYYFAGTAPSHDALGNMLTDYKKGEGLFVEFGKEGYSTTYPLISEEHGLDTFNKLPLSITLSINKFRTVGENWYIDLINVPHTPNYVKAPSTFCGTFIEYNKTVLGEDINVPFWYDLKNDNLIANKKGFTLHHDELGTLGVAISNLNNEKKQNGLALYVMAETSKINLSDYAELQLGAEVGKANTSNVYQYGISGSFLYEKEFTLDVKTDMQLDKYKGNVEASTELYFSDISINAYYVKDGPAWYFDNYLKEEKRTYGYGGTTNAKNYLCAESNVSLGRYLPKLDPTIYIYGKDILHKEKVDLGIKGSLAYNPYLMYLNFSITNILGGIKNINASVSLATDFATYTNVPFSSLIFKIGSEVSLDASDIIDGLDAGLFVRDAKGINDLNAGLRISYVNKSLKLSNETLFNTKKIKIATENKISLGINQTLSIDGAIGYGISKDTNGDILFNDDISAQLALNFNNGKFVVCAGGKVVANLVSNSFVVGAFAEAEYYIIDGAVVKLTYNPRDVNGNITPLTQDNLGVVSLSYKVEY